MSRPFIVFSLPRSRSAWLSTLMSAPSALVGHDLGIGPASVEEYVSRLKLCYAGSCETGASFAWPLIKRLLPDSKFAVILRDPEEVIASVARIGFGDQRVEIRNRYLQLRRIDTDLAPVWWWHELDNEARVAALYSHCTGREMDLDWWSKLRRLNIQIDAQQRIGAIRDNLGNIEALKADVRERMCHA